MTKGTEYNPDDILIGALAIARYMWPETGTPEQVHRMRQNSDFPFFKMKGRLCARKSSIRKWIELQEWRGKPAPMPDSGTTGKAA